jgi:Fe-Mn family superoxide dismutase
MKRREFLASLTAVTVATTLTVKGFPNIIGKAKPREFPPLPYAENALAPMISAQTVNIHYNRHHKGYFDPVNKLTEGTPLAEASFEEIIIKTYKDKTNLNSPSLFNMAAQVWNHTFYWNSLTPTGGGKPTGKMLDKINQSFGDYEGFKKQLTEASISTFGTGWSWLVADKKGKLSVVKTEDADNPLTAKLKPLLTIDVWEHAYYLDYQNKRADYVKAVIEKLLNWEFAAQNLG